MMNNDLDHWSFRPQVVKNSNSSNQSKIRVMETATYENGIHFHNHEPEVVEKGKFSRNLKITSGFDFSVANKRLLTKSDPYNSNLISN